MIRHLQAVDYEARTKLFSGEHVEHVTFNFTLENQIHRGGQYFNDKYVGTLTFHFFPCSFYPLSLAWVWEFGDRVFGSKYLWFLLNSKGVSLGGGYEGKGEVFLIILALQVHWATSEVSVL